MKNIAIYGCGGFGREIACLIHAINKTSPTWNLIGFFDFAERKGEETRYGKILGGTDDLNHWEEPLSVVMSIATPASLKKITSEIVNPWIDFPNIIAPDVLFFDPETLQIGKGNVLFFGCKVSCGVRIGNFNLANGSVSFGHEAQVGDYNVLGPCSRLSGNVRVGNENFFGVYSTVLQKITIGDKVRVGAGSIIMRNTKDDCLYHGNPAKIVKI